MPQFDTQYSNWAYQAVPNNSNNQNTTANPPYRTQPANYNNAGSQDNSFLISTPNVAEEPKPTFISGRYVQDMKSIRPNEVRSDGNPSVFPLVDRTAIITKELNEMGTIDTIVYVRQEVAQNAPSGPDPIQMIMKRLDNIEKEIKKTRYYKGNKNKGGGTNNAD